MSLDNGGLLKATSLAVCAGLQEGDQSCMKDLHEMIPKNWEKQHTSATKHVASVFQFYVVLIHSWALMVDGYGSMALCKAHKTNV